MEDKFGNAMIAILEWPDAERDAKFREIPIALATTVALSYDGIAWEIFRKENRN